MLSWWIVRCVRPDTLCAPCFYRFSNGAVRELWIFKSISDDLSDIRISYNH